MIDDFPLFIMSITTTTTNSQDILLLLKCLSLLQEASLVIDEEKKEPFFELNRILEECKNQNLDPALK